MIHLSVGWPGGLQYLLQTDARAEIDTPDDFTLTNTSGLPLAWPFSYAAAQQCSQSLGLLLDAGCNLCPRHPQNGEHARALSYALASTSVECARVFASRMARRRDELLALARSRLDELKVHLSFYEEEDRQGILAAVENGMETHSAEIDTRVFGRRFPEHFICNIVFECLRRARIPVQGWLKTCELEDHDVYGRYGVPLDFFPIFEEYGFVGYNEPDRHGLRPIMNKMQGDFFIYSTPPESIWKLLPWLIKHQCLDFKPVEARVKSRGGEVLLNENATGWHYLALVVDAFHWDLQPRFDRSVPKLSVTMNLVATIAEGVDASRQYDDCECPCNHPSISRHADQHNNVESLSGCSPFSVLCRNHFGDFSFGIGEPHKFRHCIFQHGRNRRREHNSHASGDDETPATTPVPTWQLQLLRLLTFEVLEMTHTCCVALPLNPDGRRHGIFHRSSHLERKRQQQRPETAEAHKGRQLEELIADFEKRLERGDGSARELEKFIFGPWQAQIGALYDVDDRDVNAMDGVLGSKVRASKYKLNIFHAVSDEN